jgi:hypothetical protein
MNEHHTAHGPAHLSFTHARLNDFAARDGCEHGVRTDVTSEKGGAHVGENRRRANDKATKGDKSVSICVKRYDKTDS